MTTPARFDLRPGLTEPVLLLISCQAILGMAHGAVAAMPTHEKPCPIQVGFFRLKAILQVSNAIAKLVKQPNRAQNGSGDFVRFNITAHKNSIFL
jgi:hypothetical protein